MQFWTKEESIVWMRFTLGESSPALERALSDTPSTDEIVLFFDDAPNANVALARMIVSWFGTFRGCLLYVDEYGIWSSSENDHLYYRLRNSYGDQRLLH